MKYLGKQMKRRFFRIWALHASDIRCGYLGMALMMLTAVLIRLLSGSPYRIYLLLHHSSILPPLFVVLLLGAIFTAGMGFGCGLILSDRRRAVRCIKYQGGMLFVLFAIFWFAVYPLIFRGGLLWAGLFALLIATLIEFYCALIFLRINRISGMISVAFFFWSIYLVLVLTTCIFTI